MDPQDNEEHSTDHLSVADILISMANTVEQPSTEETRQRDRLAVAGILTNMANNEDSSSSDNNFNIGDSLRGVPIHIQSSSTSSESPVALKPAESDQSGSRCLSKDEEKNSNISDSSRGVPTRTIQISSTSESSSVLKPAANDQSGSISISIDELFRIEVSKLVPVVDVIQNSEFSSTSRSSIGGQSGVRYPSKNYEKFSRIEIKKIVPFSTIQNPRVSELSGASRSSTSGQSGGKCPLKDEEKENKTKSTNDHVSAAHILTSMLKNKENPTSVACSSNDGSPSGIPTPTTPTLTSTTLKNIDESHTELSSIPAAPPEYQYQAGFAPPVVSFSHLPEQDGHQVDDDKHSSDGSVNSP